MKKNKVKAYYHYDEMSNDKTAFIIAVDQSSTATGHMCLKYTPKDNNEYFDENTTLPTPDFLFLCDQDKCYSEHIIWSKDKSANHWPETSERLKEYRLHVHHMLSKYEREFLPSGDLVKYFVCESVYFSMLHLNNITPLLRFQTIAAFAALDMGYKVYEYSSSEAKSVLGIPSGIKNSKKLVVPAINSFFGTAIPSEFSKDLKKNIESCEHVADAMALGYTHVKYIFDYLKKEKE